MVRYRPYIVFSILVVSGLLSLFLVSEGYYPVALVGSDFLSAKQLRRDYRAALMYYENFLKTYGKENQEDLKADDLQISVLEQLIENSLIGSRVRRELSLDLAFVVQGKLEDFEDNLELKEAASKLYGLSFNDFKKDVLVPQAEKEILSGRMFLRGEKFDDWLKDAKKSARVIIFSRSLRWDGERLVSGD